MSLTRHPTVGARIKCNIKKVCGTVEYSGVDGFSIQWDGGFRIFGYNETHWHNFDLVGCDYEATGAAIGQLVSQKQAAYGDSFNKAQTILRTLWPEGIRPDQYHQVLTITRIIDKMFRIANKPDAFGESPYADIAGYALLGMHSQSTDGDK